MTADYALIRLTRDAGIGRITLSRPEALNAMTRAMGIELLHAVRSCADDDTVRVVVLSGEGRAFSSGADLKDTRPQTLDGQPDLGASLQQIYNPLILALRRIPKPVIAAVNGPAAGFACALACASDFIIAAENSYFLLAFVRVGLVTDGGTSVTIPARIGLARAMQLAMLGERLPARDALNWGLVNDVCPDAELRERTTALATQLACGPRGAYAGMKELFNRQLLPALEGQLGAEAAIQFTRGVSWEYAEGVRAFGDKRRPDFSAET